MAKTSDRPAAPARTDKTGTLAGSPPASLSGLFAEENEFDRRSLLRVGTWGVITVGAVVLAVVSNQSSLGWHREQIAVGDVARQTQQIQLLAKESQNEARRLASAIDTLNTDRDRLFSRVTVLEQGLDSVTGAIAKQNTPPPAVVAAPVAAAAEPQAAAPAPANPAPPQAKAQLAPQPKQPPSPSNQQASSPPGQSPPPAVSPVASSPAPMASASVPAPSTSAPDKPRADLVASSEQAPVTAPAQFASNASALLAAASAPPPLIASKSMMGPPDPAAPKLIEAPKPVAATSAPMAAQAPQEVAAAAPSKDQGAPGPAAAEVTVNHTDFAVDLGSANSVGGLRALWRGLVRSNAGLAELRPIIIVKESTTGLGMQLRLAAGPLHDAAAAAKICAALMENKRACETTVFDGQHLAMASDEAQGGQKPAAEVKPATSSYRHVYYSRRVKRDDTPPKPESSSTLSSLLGMGKK
jgi:hypothetical protein